MQYHLGEFGYDLSHPSILLMDNLPAIQVVKRPKHRPTTKLVHRACQWDQSCMEGGDIAVSHVPENDNPAGIFTKPLGRNLAKFRAMLA